LSQSLSTKAGQVQTTSSAVSTYTHSKHPGMALAPLLGVEY